MESFDAAAHPSERGRAVRLHEMARLKAQCAWCDWLLKERDSSWKTLVEDDVVGVAGHVENLHVIFPRFGGQVDYAANAALRVFNSNSMGLT